jgi:hypothetical protein
LTLAIHGGPAASLRNATANRPRPPGGASGNRRVSAAGRAPMDLADDAVARLNGLALLNDGSLVLVVRDLVRSAIASAPSCIAVIVTIADQEPLFAIDDRLRDGVAVVRASLRAQIAASRPGQPGRQVVFLAERQGEFTDFTAMDLPATAAVDQLHTMVIDGDLDAALRLVKAGPNDDHPARTVDRAVGVLLDRGFLPAEALRELHTRARLSGHSLSEQADAVLRALR